MEKEKKRGGKSKPQRLLGALRSAFVDKPAKMAQATVSIVTSKHAVELFLRCARRVLRVRRRQNRANEPSKTHQEIPLRARRETDFSD